MNNFYKKFKTIIDNKEQYDLCVNFLTNNPENKKDIYTFYLKNSNYNSYINSEKEKQNKKTNIVKHLFSNELKSEYIEILNEYEKIKNNEFTFETFSKIFNLYSKSIDFEYKIDRLIEKLNSSFTVVEIFSNFRNIVELDLQIKFNYFYPKNPYYSLGSLIYDFYKALKDKIPFEIMLGDKNLNLKDEKYFYIYFKNEKKVDTIEDFKKVLKSSNLKNKKII